jgi:glycosyltransferase involved in cell wall biosynthesis
VRVGLVAYLLHEGRDYRSAGVSRYANRLLEALVRTCPDNEYAAFVGPDAPALPGAMALSTRAPTNRAPVRILWEQLVLPLQVPAARVDIIHGLVNVIPFAVRRPSVVTIHDLAFLRHPERFRRGRAGYLRRAVPASARRAGAVIAVSESTRKDLVELTGVPEERVSVVYPAAGALFARLPEPRVARFRDERLGGRPYILYVGTLEPRKNVDILIRAFAAVRRALDLPHLLVLVGAPGWMHESLYELARAPELKNSVRFHGYAGSEELPLWYNGADLFVYPSAYEGFGLPVLEAMACGVPVITTSSSSLVEVAGGACMTVEPGSQEALEWAMRELLAGDDMRERLREAGLARAAQFSWARTAAETVGIYARVMGQ